MQTLRSLFSLSHRFASFDLLSGSDQKKSSQPDSTKQLPDEVMKIIFSFLTPLELIKQVDLTCKRWSKIARSFENWGLPVSFEPYHLSVKATDGLKRYGHAASLPSDLKQGRYAYFKLPNLFDSPYTCFLSRYDLLFAAPVQA